MTAYNHKPKRLLERLYFDNTGNPVDSICCAGFELRAWRCIPFAEHLIEWLPEYALPEDELDVTHANIYVKLKNAAVRVYTSEKYKSRGEAGEIALHAVCRDYFNTLPISPRVFYKSASNDVVKAFDMVHAHSPPNGRRRTMARRVEAVRRHKERDYRSTEVSQRASKSRFFKTTEATDWPSNPETHSALSRTYGVV
ncbi:MAG: DUF1837 domain-containing protein [Rhodopseudomonas sp.]|nr:DUF1837 domain-containing protein [Rhodopseudomonas sp.]